MQPMVRTPRTYTIPLPAGGEFPLPCQGKWATILSLTGAVSIQAAFNSEAWTTFFPRIGYPSEAEFSQVRLRNTGAAAVTVLICISDLALGDNRADASLAAAMMVELPKTLIGITGGAGTSLFLSNPNRHIVSVSACDDNGGIVYVGSVVGVSNVAHFKPLLPGGEWFDEYHKGPVFAVGSDALQNVVGYEV